MQFVKVKLFLFMAILLISILVPLPVQAAEGAQEWGWIQTLGRWFNLIFLFGLIYYFVRKPLSEFFSERRRKLRQELEAAARAHDQAEAKLQEIQKRLEGLDQELEQIRNSARQEAESERERILNDARAEADKLIASAQNEIESVTRAARQDLRKYAAQLAVQLAEQKIRAQMDEQAEQTVRERFFVKLSGDRKEF